MNLTLSHQARPSDDVLFQEVGGEAVLLLSVDQPVASGTLDTVKALPGVKTVKALDFV